MPYTLHQYVSPGLQEGQHVYPARVDNEGVNNINSTIISQSGNQPTYLPPQLPHHHIPMNFAPPPPHHRHHHNQHHQQQQQHNNHLFPPSPPASVSSSYSSSSLSSPTLPPPATSQTVPSLPPAGYSLPSSTTPPPPPRMMPYGYSSDRGRRSAPAESEDNEVYPLDLSIRSGPRQDSDVGHENGAMGRQHHTPRPIGAESGYKHPGSVISNAGGGSRTQHRLSPYSIPHGRSGGGPAHSPSSRSPNPLRTDSPIYSRRRTPSPAYYPGGVPDGVYRTNGVQGHPYQQHFLPPGPPPPLHPAPPHLSPSPSLVVQSEHSSSPSPFQILTTADTVLHGAPIVSSLFKPYQDQMETNISAGSGYTGKPERQDEEHNHHQSRDPRRQILLQLQQQQQQQQNQIHQRPSQQQQDEEEERTYVDLDCPHPARSAYPGQSEEQGSQRGGEFVRGQALGPETDMEETNHASGGRVLNRQGSEGFGDEKAGRESERQEDLPRGGAFHQKSELVPKSSIFHDSHHYLRQAFLSSSIQQQQGVTDVGKVQKHLQQEQLLHQQHLASSRLGQREQTAAIGKEESQRIQQQQPEVDTTTSPSETSMVVSSASETDSADPSDRNAESKTDAENHVSQDVLEEAKLMAFLSKTTLVTLKPNGQFNKPGLGISGGSSEDHKGLPSAHNIFKDFHVKPDENDRPGKLPKIDFCLSSTPRAGTPSSCKGSVITPKKICFRLVDLVGLLVEQSLRA